MIPQFPMPPNIAVAMIAVACGVVALIAGLMHARHGPKL